MKPILRAVAPLAPCLGVLVAGCNSNPDLTDPFTTLFVHVSGVADAGCAPAPAASCAEPKTPVTLQICAATVGGLRSPVRARVSASTGTIGGTLAAMGSTIPLVAVETGACTRFDGGTVANALEGRATLLTCPDDELVYRVEVGTQNKSACVRTPPAPASDGGT